VAIGCRLAPGELQVLNNHTQVHNRSAYKDWEVSVRVGVGVGVGNWVGDWGGVGFAGWVGSEVAPLLLTAISTTNQPTNQPTNPPRHHKQHYTPQDEVTGNKRHLLRLWLATPPPDAIPLPPSFAHLWKRFAADDRGLTEGTDGRWGFSTEGKVPLEAEVGQAHIPAAAEAEPAGGGGG